MRRTQSSLCSDTRSSYLVKIGLPLASVGVIIAFTCTLYALVAYPTRTNEIIDVYCTPSGTVHVSTEHDPHYNPYWNPELFLSITFGFGEFQYATAKGIDIVWDVVVGRVGQIFLAILAYPVIRRSLAYYMERKSVHIDAYASIAFDKISLPALWTTVRDICGHSRRSDRRIASLFPTFNWRFFAHALVFMYILGFPTMVSVMTGYQAKFNAYVERPDNQFLMKVDELKIPSFVIRDGSRIGMQDLQPIYPEDPNIKVYLAYSGDTYGMGLQSSNGPIFVFGEDDTFIQYCLCPELAYDWPGDPHEACAHMPWWHQCSFQTRYGRRPPLPGHPKPDIDDMDNSHFAESNITLNDHTWQLEDPPLDIIAQIHTGSVGTATINYMSTGNLTFSSDYLRANSKCEPSDKYEWGFSSLLLLVFCLFTIIFAMILTALHADAFWNSRADRHEYDVNHFRDAVDIVYELRDNYVEDSILHMPARELVQGLHDRDKSMQLDIKELPPSRSEQWRLDHPNLRNKETAFEQVNIMVDRLR